MISTVNKDGNFDKMLSIIYKTQCELLYLIGSNEDHPLMSLLDEISGFIEAHEACPCDSHVVV